MAQFILVPPNVPVNNSEIIASGNELIVPVEGSINFMGNNSSYVNPLTVKIPLRPKTYRDRLFEATQFYHAGRPEFATLRHWCFYFWQWRDFENVFADFNEVILVQQTTDYNGSVNSTGLLVRTESFEAALRIRDIESLRQISEFSRHPVYQKEISEWVSTNIDASNYKSYYDSIILKNSEDAAALILRFFDDNIQCKLPATLQPEMLVQTQSVAV